MSGVEQMIRLLQRGINNSDGVVTLSLGFAVDILRLLKAAYVETEQTGKEIIFYFKQQNKKKQNFKIALSGKRLKESLHEFIKLNYEKVKLKNLELLRENGYKFKTNNNNYCFIKWDKIEIINKTYKSYNWNEIKNISYDKLGTLILITITTKYGNTIKFSNYMLEGGIGIIEFLLKIASYYTLNMSLNLTLYTI